jgi:hypothetical protein
VSTELTSLVRDDPEVVEIPYCDLVTQNRPDIPAELRRAILVEAGHRCAIPQCRQTPVELAHISPWSKVHEHAFDNLIALCPTCHTRYDRGEIDRKSMVQYKANLSLLSNRYTEIERQLLRAFARKLALARQYHPGLMPKQLRHTYQIGQVRIYSEMDWLLTNLFDDVIVEFRVEEIGALQRQEQGLNSNVVLLTDKGADFLSRWIDAQPLDLD